MDEREFRARGKSSFIWIVWLVLLAMLTGACGLEGLQLPESPLLRNLERKSGLIAYLGTDGNVYTIDQAGSRQNSITSDAQTIPDDSGLQRLYQFPTWSPDGRKLAFVGFNGGQSSGDFATLFTVSRDGGDPVEAYQSDEQFPFYLYWSPDSEQITFLTTLPNQEIALKVVPAGGGDTHTLETGSPFYWDWAPDNHTLLIHTGGSALLAPGARIALIDVEREFQEELDLRPISFQAPAWSPLGDEFLLGVVAESGGQSLLLTNRDGDRIKELAQVSGPVYFDWSPDGEHLAYLTIDPEAQDSFSQALTVLETDAPETARKAKEELVMAFFWSPDSRRIALFTPAVFDPTPVPGQQAPNERVLLLRLHVMDVGSGESQELALFRPTEEFLSIIPHFDQYQRSATIWSPDSRNIVIAANNPEGQAGIYVVEAAGNLQPRLISAGSLAFWSWK